MSNAESKQTDKDEDDTGVKQNVSGDEGTVVRGDTYTTDGLQPAKKLKPSGAVIVASTATKDSHADNAADEKQENGAAKDAPVEYHFKRAMDSTRTVEPEAPSRDAATKQARAATPASDSDKTPADADQSASGIYTGKKGYINRAAGAGSRRAGPFKAPTNVRSTSVFDYQPNVCKDYKETGYCGYGDSCIFLHDRGTYKTGWQLEKEFEEAQAGVQRDNSKLWKVGDDDNSGSTGGSKTKSEELPFACLICRNPFKQPVMTKCQHYFCEACALQNYKKTPKCFACGAATNGVFKPAKNIATRD
ncbi:RNA-splicing factor [Coemansia erecta]|uniref:Pre-mRNA-splicing factor CWC24 n=1 Tax=Coemansia erecta TaxID=147472 RepID=A0A9W7Y2Z1_9FUNG|nr:RNA-splicing factor [Coemansia erecta]